MVEIMVEICVFLLNSKGRIVGMGWTDSEQLVCVLDDGTVRIYSIHGEYTQFSLGKVEILSFSIIL